MASITPASSSSSTTFADEVSATSNTHDLVDGSSNTASDTSEDQSQLGDLTDVASVLAASGGGASGSESLEDSYQKIIATLREQIKSTNEELKKNGKMTTVNAKRITILRRQKAGLEGILKATQEGNTIKVRLFARQLSQIHKDMIKEMEKEKHRVQNQITALEEQVVQHQDKIRQSKGKGRQ